MPAPDGKIDEQRYRDGVAAWDQGVTLRAVLEQTVQNPDEAQSMSYALGFADGALGALRKMADRAR